MWSRAVFEQAAFALAFEVLSLSFTFTFSVYGAGLNTRVSSVSSFVRADQYWPVPATTTPLAPTVLSHPDATNVRHLKGLKARRSASRTSSMVPCNSGARLCWEGSLSIKPAFVKSFVFILSWTSVLLPARSPPIPLIPAPEARQDMSAPEGSGGGGGGRVHCPRLVA